MSRSLALARRSNPALRGARYAAGPDSWSSTPPFCTSGRMLVCLAFVRLALSSVEAVLSEERSAPRLGRPPPLQSANGLVEPSTPERTLGQLVRRQRSHVCPALAVQVLLSSAGTAPAASAVRVVVPPEPVRTDPLQEAQHRAQATGSERRSASSFWDAACESAREAARFSFRFALRRALRAASRSGACSGQNQPSVVVPGQPGSPHAVTMETYRCRADVGRMLP